MGKRETPKEMRDSLRTLNIGWEVPSSASSGGGAIPDYDAGTEYQVDDMVVYNGAIYKCIQIGTGQTPDSSPLYWEVYPVAAVASSITPWTTALALTSGDIIIYKNILFQANSDFTTAGTFAADLDKFTCLSEFAFIVNQGNTFTQFQPVYITGGVVTLAIADATATIATHVVLEVSATYVLLANYGRFTFTGHGLTVGANYTSDTVAGDLVTTAPSINNLVYNVVDTDIIEILVNKDTFYTADLTIDHTTTTTGSENVVDFADTESLGAEFKLIVSKGTNFRYETIKAVWDAVNDTISTDGGTSTSDIGDTSDVVFTVAIVANRVTLSVVSATTGWAIKGEVEYIVKL